MNVDPADVRHSAHRVADAGAVVGDVAGLADRSQSVLGRVGFALSAVKLGIRLVPMGIRLVQRHPLGAALTVAGVAWWVYANRRQAARARFGAHRR
jgi:hypothetical protein